MPSDEPVFYHETEFILFCMQKGKNLLYWFIDVRRFIYFIIVFSLHVIVYCS
jgi:hypothetical protein